MLNSFDADKLSAASTVEAPQIPPVAEPPAGDQQEPKNEPAVQAPVDDPSGEPQADPNAGNPVVPPVADKPAETPQEKEAAEKELEFERKAEEKLLRKLGVSSLDELRKKEAAEPSEEEKKLATEKETAAINKYAVDNNKLTNADIVRLNNIKSTPDEKLVFDNFAKEFKEANKDRKDDLGDPSPVTDEDVKAAFDTAFHKNTKDPVLLKLGEKMIAKEASAIKGDLEDKYKEASEQFKDYSVRKAKGQEYKAFLKGFLATNTPSELTYGEGDQKVTYKLDEGTLTKKDREDIEKFFVNDKYFENFIKDGGGQKTRDEFKEDMRNYLVLKHHDKIVKTYGDVRYEAGLKAGKIGAEAPFKQDKSELRPIISEGVITKEEAADVASAFRKY